MALRRHAENEPAGESPHVKRETRGGAESARWLLNASARGPRTPSAICAVLLSWHSAHRAPRWSVASSWSASVRIVSICRRMRCCTGRPRAFACSRFALRSCGARRDRRTGLRAQIADGVRGPRADASESTRCAVRAVPCLSLTSHTRRRARVLRGAQGNAARRRLSETILEAPVLALDQRPRTIRGAVQNPEVRHKMAPLFADFLPSPSQPGVRTPRQ